MRTPRSPAPALELAHSGDEHPAQDDGDEQSLQRAVQRRHLRRHYGTMTRIATQVLAFAAALDSAELPQTGREQFSDTLDLEISQLKVAFGSWWEPMLQFFGLDAVTRRTDMDRLVLSLLGLGL